MGIAYVVVGGICIVLGAGFAVAHLFRPRYGLYALVTQCSLLMFNFFPGNSVIIRTCPGILRSRAQRLLPGGMTGLVLIEIGLLSWCF